VFKRTSRFVWEYNAIVESVYIMDHWNGFDEEGGAL